jgi:hypothetical protein
LSGEIDELDSLNVFESFVGDVDKSFRLVSMLPKEACCLRCCWCFSFLAKFLLFAVSGFKIRGDLMPFDCKPKDDKLHNGQTVVDEA